MRSEYSLEEKTWAVRSVESQQNADKKKKAVDEQGDIKRSFLD